MSITIDLAGKVALVTGASQGIGAEIARALHNAGATVVLNHPGPPGSQADLDTRSLVDRLNADGPLRGFVEIADMAQAETVHAMMARVRDNQGGLDILVNNAGILRDRSLAKMPLDDWRAVLDVNLTGVFHGCKYGLEVMRDSGSIVNLGSLSAKAGFFGQANYAAAKAGVHALTLVLSKECAKRGIRVNAVAPGVIDTPMIAQVSNEVRERMKRAVPLGRFGCPSEVAAVVLFLVSDLAAYVSGSIIDVNGGWFGQA